MLPFLALLTICFVTVSRLVKDGETILYSSFFLQSKLGNALFSRLF
jgi:hypothetical protein